MCDLSAVPWHASCGSKCLNWLQMVGAAIDRCGRRRLVSQTPCVSATALRRDAPKELDKPNPKFFLGNFEVGK